MVPFDPEKATNDIVEFIRGFFESSGGKVAVVGLSGGKDSTIVAALCARALGKKMVIGVIMPNGKMNDINYAKRAAALYCEGGCFEISIYNAVNAIRDSVLETDQARMNLPARIRMATLYYVAQNMNHGRVANTCNASENYVGYSTWYGDNAGDFAPLHDFTVQEVRAIGRYLGVPTSLVDKVPDDGLCGLTDEDNLGFSYATLDKYIRTGVCEDQIIKKKIDGLHEKNLFKLLPIPHPSNTQKPREKTSPESGGRGTMHKCKRCGVGTDFFIESYCPLEERRITTWLCADCIFDANILLERFVGKEEEE